MSVTSHRRPEVQQQLLVSVSEASEATGSLVAVGLTAVYDAMRLP